MSAPRTTAAIVPSRWAPTVLWTCCILLLTSWPGLRITTEVTWTDKIGHFSMYGILGLLVARALRPPRTAAALLVAMACMASFGALDELHQMWIPGRSASSWDWLADVLGAFVGLFATHHVLPLAQARQDLLS